MKRRSRRCRTGTRSKTGCRPATGQRHESSASAPTTGCRRPSRSTSPFPTLPSGPGVWRLTPPAYAAPQTPWMANVRPFVLRSADQFLPPPPPSLHKPRVGRRVQRGQVARRDRQRDAHARNRRRSRPSGQRTSSASTTSLARGIADTEGLDVPGRRAVCDGERDRRPTRIAFMNAKYHYLFWRPVTAIDPTSVTNDGFGPVPGFADGNPLTRSKPGWRPLLATPNHPEYPSAHATFTSAIAEVLTQFLGTDRTSTSTCRARPLQRHPPLRDRRRPADGGRERTHLGRAALPLLRRGGLALGRAVADYDLGHAFGSGG